MATYTAERSGDNKDYGNCLGNAYQSLGDVKTAIDYYEHHLKIAKELGDRSDEGKAYGDLGVTYYRLGDFKTAIDYYERQLKIAKELGDKSSEEEAYWDLGNAYQRLGDFKTAIEYHERNLQISKELGDRSNEGRACGNLGNAHHSLGDIKIAIEYYERHLKIAEELGDRSVIGKVYGNLGSAYQSLRDIKTATDYNERHLKIAKQLGDRSSEGIAYGNLGNDQFLLGNYRTAINYQESYLNIAKELGDKWNEGKIYGNLGSSYQKLGDFKTAIDYHELDLKIAKEMGDRSGEADALGNLSNAYQSLGYFKRAIDYLERTLKIARELGDIFQEGIACGNIGSNFACLGQYPEAIRYCQRGVTLYDNIRNRLQLNDEWKVSLRDRYQRLYIILWTLMLEEGKVTEALFSAEQGRAQGLKDLMELSYAVEENAELIKEIRTFQELCSGLPPNTIFMAIGNMKELVLWVCRKGKEVELRRKQIRSQYEINTFFQSLLKKFDARNYVQCEDRSLDSAKNKRLPDKTSPQDGSRKQQFHLQERVLSTFYDTVIDPIQDLFTSSELVFVPDGPLCLAPFAAFKGPDSKYLCESFKIRVAPSLTSLKMIVDCPVDHHLTSGVLLVGDPWVQDVTTLEQLPFAREEVEMIGRVLGCPPLIGRQATKDEVLKRLGSVALVHFAAHGSMEAGEIALAPKNGEMDFILTMKDVKRVQMRARLVVLSCCHSAHGEIKAEGVVGIARAFLGAGARSVLVSLWAIDDRATLEFMKHFYQYLMKGKSASKALKQAMNCMRESGEFSAVNHWAPFVLIGDDVTLEFGGSK